MQTENTLWSVACELPVQPRCSDASTRTENWSICIPGFAQIINQSFHKKCPMLVVLPIKSYIHSCNRNKNKGQKKHVDKSFLLVNSPIQVCLKAPRAFAFLSGQMASCTLRSHINLHRRGICHKATNLHAQQIISEVRNISPSLNPSFHSRELC